MLWVREGSKISAAESTIYRSPLSYMASDSDMGNRTDYILQLEANSDIIQTTNGTNPKGGEKCRILQLKAVHYRMSKKKN